MTCDDDGSRGAAAGLWCRLQHLVGHRGLALLIFGVYDFVYGWTRLISPDPETRQSQQIRLISELFPPIGPDATLAIWGYLWWAAGAVCLTFAFRSDDRWGYGVAIGIKVSWLGANVWAWSQGLVGGGGVVATWAFILAMCAALAFRAEPITQYSGFVGHTGEGMRRED